MSVTTEMTSMKTLSWGSIIAGIVTVLAISILLSTLGTSLGFAMIDPTSDDPVNGAGTAVGIWSMFSIVLSLFLGSFIAGRLAGCDGMIHGFLNWACALIVATILGAMLISSSMKTADSALGSIASVSGSMLSRGGEMVGKGLSGLGDAGASVFKEITLDTQLSPDNLQNDVETALRNADIPALHPDFLKQQLQGAKDDILAAVRRIAVSGDSSEQVVKDLNQKLKQRSSMITTHINRDDIKHALAKNTTLSAAEADRMVDNIIHTRDQLTQEVSQRLDDVEVKINQAQHDYDIWKKETAEKAAQLSSSVAKASLWSFFALLIGAIMSALGGLWGVKTTQ